MTHNEAVQIFITAGNTVRMKVQHGAYAELMVSIFYSHEVDVMVSVCAPLCTFKGICGKILMLAFFVCFFVETVNEICK